jgi:hypothetical protein
MPPQLPSVDLEDARRRAREARTDLDQRNPNWEAEVVVMVTILLGLALPDELTVGSRWIVPTCEGALLLGLVASTPRSPSHEDPRRRIVRIALVAFVSAVNVVALFLLTQSLLEGGKQDGRALLTGGTVLWATSVLLFAVAFWELDRGGPVRRVLGHRRPPDFLFPHMAEDEQPSLGDYLYLSLTNASSFAPAETWPLTGGAKALMALQTVASLTTILIIISYATNNLG